jgi:hypothetical protein
MRDLASSCTRSRHDYLRHLGILILAMLSFAATTGLSSSTAAAAERQIFSEGGAVQTDPHVYAIFWGSNWNSTGERGRLETLYKDLSNSSWEGTLTQYWGSETSSVGAPQGFVSHQVGFNAWLDSSVAAPSGVNNPTMLQEISAAIKANGWPQQPSVSNQFVILTPAGTTYSLGSYGYCGYHSWAGSSAYPERAFAFVPWGKNESGNPFSNCVMTVTAAHEFAETATDPFGQSWGIGTEGKEVADRCGGASKGELPGGIVVPSIWDEASSSCTLGNSNPPQVAPKIAPEAPLSLLQTSATLRGKTTPNGVSVHEYYFEWGQTWPEEVEGERFYENETLRETFFGNFDSAASLTGLSPNTTYHFRLVVFTNTGERVRSADREFTTLEYPPENTVPPSISVAPHIATPLTTNQGSWTHSPSYKYEWLRCKTTSGTECSTILGQASATYTPTDADAGYTLVVSVTAYNSGGSVTVRSKPTVRVPTQHWYSCRNVGEGKGVYSDSACQKEGGGKSYALNKLSSTATGFSMAGVPGKVAVKGFASNPSFIMGWTLSGVKLRIACSGSSGAGQIQNPLTQNPGGGVAGTVANTTLTLKGCVVFEPESLACKVKGGGITTAVLSGTATEFHEKSAVRFQSQSGGSLFTLQLEQCKSSFFNSTFPVAGSFTGVVDSASSAFEFDESGSALTIGGQKAWFAGASKLSTAGGEPLRVAP